jgi:peptidoglycan/xylan/chitin deacetylase (PgdA/CDA1 family)
MSTATPTPILLYHSLSVEATDRYRRFAMAPKSFAEQMAHIAGRGNSVLSVGEFVAALGDPSGRMPARPLVMTFDDGFLDTFEVGSPILAEHGFHATVYVVTGSLGGSSTWLEGDGEGARRLMSPAQVRELDAAGIEIGPHGHRHVPLDTLSFAQAAQQIDTSKAVLEDILGHAVTTFAYPYGYHTNRIKAYLRACGFTSASGVKQALSHRDDDLFALARIVVGADTPLATFDTWLGGEGLPLGWRRERPQAIAWRLARRVNRAIRTGNRGHDSADV